jgi:hypothetical protein
MIPKVCSIILSLCVQFLNFPTPVTPALLAAALNRLFPSLNYNLIPSHPDALDVTLRFLASEHSSITFTSDAAVGLTPSTDGSRATFVQLLADDAGERGARRLPCTLVVDCTGARARWLRGASSDVDGGTWAPPNVVAMEPGAGGKGVAENVLALDAALRVMKLERNEKDSPRVVPVGFAVDVERRRWEYALASGE